MSDSESVRLMFPKKDNRDHITGRWQTMAQRITAVYNPTFYITRRHLGYLKGSEHKRAGRLTEEEYRASYKEWARQLSPMSDYYN